MTVQELTQARQEATTAQTRVEQLEAEITRRPQASPVGQGLGVCERFLDAHATMTQWCGVLASEKAFVGLVCYTFDLEGVMQGLIGVRRRGGRVCVLADERHTHDSRTTGQLFARGQSEGIEIRCGRGRP